MKAGACAGFFNFIILFNFCIFVINYLLRHCEGIFANANTHEAISRNEYV